MANLNTLNIFMLNFFAKFHCNHREGIPIEDFKVRSVSTKLRGVSTENRSIFASMVWRTRFRLMQKICFYVVTVHCTSYIHSFELNLGAMLSKNPEKLNAAYASFVMLIDLENCRKVNYLINQLLRWHNRSKIKNSQFYFHKFLDQVHKSSSVFTSLGV